MKNTTLTKGSSSVPHVFPPDADHFHWDSVSTWMDHITPADLSVAHSATNLVFSHPVVVYWIQVWRPLDSSCWWNQFETAAALWRGALLCLRTMVNCGHRTKKMVSNNTLTVAWLIGVMAWSESRKLSFHHYTTSSSLDCWHKAAWVQTLTLPSAALAQTQIHQTIWFRFLFPGLMFTGYLSCWCHSE